MTNGLEGMGKNAITRDDITSVDKRIQAQFFRLNLPADDEAREDAGTQGPVERDVHRQRIKERKNAVTETSSNVCMRSKI